MGLGSGDVSFGRDVAVNTKQLVVQTAEILKNMRGTNGSIRSFNRPMTWSMR